MNVLITGAYGFVGSNLAQSMRRDLKARLIALDIIHADNPDYENFYTWNDFESLKKEKIDAIIHLAGKAHDTRNSSHEKEYFDINVGLTRKVFQFFRESDAGTFIFFSSVKAVADSVSESFLTESVLPNPQTPYGKSKLEAEKFILSQKLPENKKVFILRPCMIHGPGNKGNLNLLFQVVKKGIPWPLGFFDNQRSYTSIENLNLVIRKLLSENIAAGIYQVADDETISTNRLIELIAESQKRKSRIWHLNKSIIQFFAKMGDFLKLPLNSERLKKLTESYVVSNQKLKKALDIEKMPVSAEEGMKNTLISF